MKKIDNNAKIKKNTRSVTPVTVFSLISAITGLLSLLFLLGKGVTLESPIRYPESMNLGSIIFGTQVFLPGVNIGLLIAFISVILASVLALLTNYKKQLGFVSIVFFLLAAVLWFCTVPLYGNMQCGLGYGSIFLGIFGIIDAILIFVGATYR